MAPRHAVCPEGNSIIYARSTDVDEGYLYVQHNSSIAESITTYIDLEALRRRIDWRIIPIMLACYAMQFLDNILFNYAADMGLKSGLHLKGSNFSNASAALFIACLIAEVPNAYILQKMPLATLLGCSVTASGITTFLMAGTSNYITLLVARIFRGIFQSVIAPCLMLITSQYYTISEQALRFNFWFCGFGLAQIVGGMVSFIFQNIGQVTFGSQRIESWKIMFLVLGFVTVLVGILTVIILPNTPMSAKWMTPAEKIRLLNYVSSNRTGTVNHRFKAWEVVELLFDMRTWTLTLLTIFGSIPLGFIMSHSSTLLESFGRTPKIAALLNMPSGVVSILCVLAVGKISTAGGVNGRWYVVGLCYMWGILGGCLMYSYQFGPLLTGIYFVNVSTGAVSLLHQWTMANVAGHTKRPFASALITAGFALGNIIGLESFTGDKTSDGDKYFPIFMIMEACGSGVIFAVLLCLLYWKSNTEKRNRLWALTGLGVQLNHVENTWGNLTDIENFEFRYAY